MRRWPGTLLAAVLLVGTAAAAGEPLTVLPRPVFPAPVPSSSNAGRLMLVASRARDPALSPPRPAPPAWAARTFRGEPLLLAVRQPAVTFLLYGEDGASARYLVSASTRTHATRYAFDFRSYARPPRTAPGEGAFVTEQVVWAREADGVLYVETAHQTYASSSYGLNAYVTAIDLETRRAIWRSPALVANAGTFVLAGDVLVTGYGFTREPDHLYLLDRRTGRVLDRLPVPSAPETIARHGDRLTVRTYDHVLVVDLRR